MPIKDTVVRWLTVTMSGMRDNSVRRPRSGLCAMVVEDESELAALVGSYREHDAFEVTLSVD